MNSLKQNGFTLVEATIVIVITGIIAAIVAVFIRLPMQGYVDSAARAELVDEADTALRRMARDLRLALPNSIRTSVDADGNSYIEFLLTKTGGRYLSAEDNPTAGSILDFADDAATRRTFSVVGSMPSGVQQIVAGDRVAVYNLGSGYSPADAYAGGNIATVSAVGTSTITLSANPFAVQTPKMRSPTNRFQVVSGPVTYTCRGTNLLRHWNYAIQPSQPNTVAALAAAGGSSALLSTHLATGGANCVFSNNVLANRNSGLIGLQITLQSPVSNGGTITMFHQVHVDNTP